MTAMFLFIILGSTHGRAPAGFAPIAIGLGLTLIHLISIPVTNTSVNPARSTAVAVFAGGGYLGQLWLFWVAPLHRRRHRRRALRLAVAERGAAGHRQSCRTLTHACRHIAEERPRGQPSRGSFCGASRSGLLRTKQEHRLLR